MKVKQTLDLQKIINYYGAVSQIDMAVEECAELQHILMKSKRKEDPLELRDAIIDEIADVQHMLLQLELIFNCELDVAERIRYKVDRTLKRIDEERVVINRGGDWR